VAQAFQPPSVPYVRPARTGVKPGNAVGLALIFVGFFTFMFGTLAAAVTGVVHPILVAIVGFGLMFGGGAVFAFSDSGETRAIPPPPAVQAPPAPAPGPRGAIEIPCPNCGAPPTGVDRFGVATCAYCQTRFLVR
jgi:hypothetical protein